MRFNTQLDYDERKTNHFFLALYKFNLEQYCRSRLSSIGVLSPRLLNKCYCQYNRILFTLQRYLSLWFSMKQSYYSFDRGSSMYNIRVCCILLCLVICTQGTVKNINTIYIYIPQTSRFDLMKSNCRYQ